MSLLGIFPKKDKSLKVNENKPPASQAQDA